jgi:hypothetical protein
MGDVNCFDDDFSRQLVSKIDELMEIERRRTEASQGASDDGALIAQEASVREEIRRLVLDSAEEDSASG